MIKASVSVDRRDPISPVRRRLFGSFVEHMGRGVYEGIYEPDHPSAGRDGFRSDVLELVRELGVSTIRYPGGNFVSGFRWEDSVGPIGDRPVRRDLAWHALETNEVGLQEFSNWAGQANCEVMYALNLGTRGVQEALDIQEYATHPGATTLSNLRKQHGREEPYDIRMWCLGNEMDGPWQVGHTTAEQYGRLAAQTAQAMRLANPDVELVACGSSGSDMPTFGEWERTVLEACYDEVDYISCHAYYEEVEGDTESFLSSGANMDFFISTVTKIADTEGALRQSTKRIDISFDEWNVWYLSRYLSEPASGDWPTVKPVIQDTFTLLDSVVVGGLLISLLRNSDRVVSASLAQLVNVIAPIRTEKGGPAWRQTIFHPFALTSRLAQGEVLRTSVVAPTQLTKKHGSVPVVDAIATSDGQSISLFVINRSGADSVSVDVSGISSRAAVGWRLSGPDHYVVNTAIHPNAVIPEKFSLAAGAGLELPPASWSALSFDCEPS